MDKIKISVVCPFNKIDKINSFLLPSLSRQNGNFCTQEILIDTTKKHFSSAVEAINFGMAQADGEIIVVCHQDIQFGPDLFSKLIDVFLSGKNVGVIGLAGCASKGYHGWPHSAISHGTPYPGKPAGITFSEDIFPVQTVDECFFAFKKQSFSALEDIGAHWHLYAVDLCLRAELHGFQNYIINLPAWHESAGASFNKQYWLAAANLRKKYRRSFTIIKTTVGPIYTSPLHFFLNKTKRELMRAIRAKKRNRLS